MTERVIAQRQRGTKPVPNELKRRRGNPGKRPLPDEASIVKLPGSVSPMEPPLPLGEVGTQFWATAWKAAYAWLADSDRMALALLCQSLDERETLRASVQASGDNADRLALRRLDQQIIGALSLFGFTPTDRTRLGVAEVRVDELEAFKSRGKAG